MRLLERRLHRQRLILFPSVAHRDAAGRDRRANLTERLPKRTETDILAVMPNCVVSFVDLDGFRHTVEVEAESLFEAGALAISAFRRHECEPGPISRLDIEITSTVKHTVTPQRIRDWISSAAKSPKDLVLKERLRKLV